MLSQPNLRSCSLRWRRAEGGGAGGRWGKSNTGVKKNKKMKKNKSKACKKEEHKRSNSKKMSIKVWEKKKKDWKASQAGRNKRNGATGRHGGKYNRGHDKKRRDDAERTQEAFFKYGVFLKKTPKLANKKASHRMSGCTGNTGNSYIYSVGNFSNFQQSCAGISFNS